MRDLMNWLKDGLALIATLAFCIVVYIGFGVTVDGVVV